ncbi:putative bifunctional diguanylate cyclase/phosphodiesterase [uncultured Jatrophihabitans sp.]|uniref:putative bifunctional diguanylate cyclase/phosphodiesterase n=1 Tax=uncultured Jatrophihabitans sp. TaxID=1610747 RepID=UPI0035CA6FB1
MWTLLAPGLAAIALADARDPAAAQVVLTGALGAFFLLLLTRLAVAAGTQRQRRYPLLLLFGGVLLWAAGSAVLNGSGQPDRTSFPAPGEAFFLLAYVAIAGYLLADTAPQRSKRGATWLEAANVCGGAVCIAGGVLITPAAQHVHADGLGVLLALLYPLLDVVLGVLVVGQVLMRYRDSSRESASLLLGFGLFTFADLSFITNLSSGTYAFHWLNIVSWGAGFALIVDAACRPRATSPTYVPQRSLPIAVLVASMAATVVLAFEPDGAVRTYLLIPAMATLAAAGGRMLVAVRDAQRAAQAAALSLSDDLTGLPNRRAVYDRLDQRMSTDGPLALMLMDLDGFKDINDTLGHSAGDAVLRELAARCRAFPPGVMVARLGGDEFAILVDSADEIVLYELAQAVLTGVREPITVDGITLSVDASIGITIRQPQDTQSSELLRRADVAMYDAKRARLGVVLYEPTSDQFSRQRLALGEDLRLAIQTGQLELWYQPQQDASTGRTCAVEALIRWRHPTRGVLAPAEFLPVARRSGLMLTLSAEIGRIAVADVAAWRRRGINTRVAINCAAPELMSGIFLPQLAESIAAAGLSPSEFIIEVTEDSFLAEPERARALLTDLTALGFEISVDDYGTGFSSLSYLRDLPITEIKMDRSFVAAMSRDTRSRLIVVSTFHLADALGLRMVAEGVEDAETAHDLVALGVHVLQGYHLSRPLPPEDITTYLSGDLEGSTVAAREDSERDLESRVRRGTSRFEREVRRVRHLYPVQPDAQADRPVGLRVEESLPVHR